MKSNAHNARRLLLMTAFVLGFTGMVQLFSPAGLTEQSGGSYTVRPSVIPAGGGTSATGNTVIEGSIGQHTANTSTGVPYKLESGFWPNAAACPSELLPLGEFFTLSGGPGSVNVIAPTFCQWSATVSDDWLTLTSKGIGSGNGILSFEARENFTGSARQAVINISGSQLVVVQDAGLGEDCGYAISPSFAAFAASGGSGIISVTAEDRCGWQAATAESWISFTSINVGIGNRLVSYVVGANSSRTARAGTIIIGGKPFAIKQKGS